MTPVMIMQPAPMTMDHTLVFVRMDLQEMDSIVQVRDLICKSSIYLYEVKFYRQIN